MDYYDFFDGRKQVISQTVHDRVLVVFYMKKIVIIDEYYDSVDKRYNERNRITLNSEEITKLYELI